MSPAPASKRRRGRHMDIADRIHGPGLDTRPRSRPENRPRSIPDQGLVFVKFSLTYYAGSWRLQASLLF